MRLLLVTEKFDAAPDQRDGGARLVASLVRAFGEDMDVLQFDLAHEPPRPPSAWRRRYPHHHPDRFERRLRNAAFIAEQVRVLSPRYSHVLFVHVSMQFGFAEAPLEGPRVWTCPMFLTPSYEASGEPVPAAYTAMERATLQRTGRVLTPSHMEKLQLVERYGVPEARVRVVPRGVDLRGLRPRTRRRPDAPRFVSVGSIKRQKNTIGLIRLFARLRERHPESTLRLVGPAQDAHYTAQVHALAEELGVADALDATGFVPPNRLGEVLDDCDLHLSTSSCETFGRAIFETLASGLPGVAARAENAACAFLDETPYARFTDSLDEAVDAVDSLLQGYAERSAEALEVGEIFDDALLGTLLAAELREHTPMAVCDYDGTLFHKADPARTERCFEAFSAYPVRVVCSARPVPALREAMQRRGATADFLIGWSGAVLADGRGRVMERWPLEPQALPAGLARGAKAITDGDALIQLALGERRPGVLPPTLRAETYQGQTFLSSRRASKLRAAQALLRHLRWDGRVRAFGDGPHDEELLTWFDGTRVRETRDRAPWLRHAPEVTHADP